MTDNGISLEDKVNDGLDDISLEAILAEYGDFGLGVPPEDEVGARSRRIVMEALGETFAPALHTGVGEYLGREGISCLVAVGEMSRYIAQGARDAGVPLIHHCNTREEAKALLPQLVQPDATFLVKASRGMKLEELTGVLLELTRDPGEG